jgi:outer membrane protein, heavy metal efflux system
MFDRSKAVTLMLSGCAWLALGWANAAHAQSEREPPRALGLPAAQAEARAHAPESALLEARIRGASITASDAERVFRSDPNLALEYGRSFEGDAEWNWRVGVDWTIDVAGSWGPRASSAAEALARSAQEREDGLRALDEAVAIAVAELALAQRKQARATRMAALHESTAAAMRRQLELGQVNQLEVDAAELDLAAARSALALAGGERATAAAGLTRLLGRRPGSELIAQDAPETLDASEPQALEALVERDPRVLARRAEARAAGSELALNDRLAWPALTLGAEFGRAQHEVPDEAWMGSSATPGDARWLEWEFALKLGFPLPLFDRNREARARASAQHWAAEAELELARADVRAELHASAAALRTAVEAYRAVEPTAALLERGYAMLEQTARAGALDSVTRAQATRRLVEAGLLLDAAVRDLRVARARWLRRSR